MQKVHAWQVCFHMRSHQDSSKEPPQPLRAPLPGLPACGAGLAAPPPSLPPLRKPFSNNTQMLKTRYATLPLPHVQTPTTASQAVCYSLVASKSTHALQQTSTIFTASICMSDASPQVEVSPSSALAVCPMLRLALRLALCAAFF